MAFNINNLPVGWSAGRVGNNRVFRTPDGKQISADEAAKQLLGGGDGGSFTGFGSSDDDVIVNDPLSASSGMTIKRPTMEQPIVDDPNLNLRNGASDGAGQPDGIDNGGGVINADVPDIFNDSTGNFLDPNTSLGGATKAGIATAMENNPSLTWNQAYREALAANGNTVNASGGKGGPGNPSILDSTDAWATSGEAPLKTPEEKIKNFDDTLKLLGSGNFDAVTQKYQKAIDEIELLGGIPLKTIKGVGVGGDGLDQQVQWGRTYGGQEGWGVLTADGLAVIITEASVKAGTAYQAELDEFDRMKNFIENASAAQTDDARAHISNQEMARLEDSIGDENRKANQENTLATIKAQGNVQSGLQDDAQQASVDAAKLVADAKLEETRLGREFTTDEREAYQAYQDIVRTGEYGTQAFTVSEREAIQEWQQAQRTGVGGTQEFATGEREASQTESERIRLIEADIRKLEISEGRTFTTEERKAIQAFQVSREEISRTQQLEDQRTGQAFAIGERRAGESFSSKQADLNRVFSADQSTLDREAASTRQEDTQEFEEEQSRLSETFQIRRDELRFEQESKLESARTGIADATSEEGIARAVELANEARSLERTMAMIDVIEQISASGLGRQLSESGLLEQLGDQFGVDMSFLLSGGLSTGGGGGAPVRITA